jgi:hypothetical protein
MGRVYLDLRRSETLSLLSDVWYTVVCERGEPPQEKTIMMKSNSTPRRVYTRNNTIHVLFAGKTFGPGSEKTNIAVGNNVKCEITDIDAKDGKHCHVTKKVVGKKGVAEVWHTVTVPCKHRS